MSLIRFHNKDFVRVSYFKDDFENIQNIRIFVKILYTSQKLLLQFICNLLVPSNIVIVLMLI